ncbi:MAG TPA: sigma factor [Candidatus Limnocylindrales bacterium]
MISAEAQVGSRADAFAQLVDRQLNDAFRPAGYILGNTPDAEDAVQEAIIRAWQAWVGSARPSASNPGSIGSS